MPAQTGLAGSLPPAHDHFVAPRNPAKAAILIVDDDEQHRVMLRRLLQRNGFDVVEAENGELAYQYLKAHATTLPALVIADGQMPVMDGWELVLRLQGDPRFSSLPVIMVSGAHAAPPAGLRAFFQKPFEPASLVAAIHEHTASSLSAA